MSEKPGTYIVKTFGFEPETGHQYRSAYVLCATTIESAAIQTAMQAHAEHGWAQVTYDGSVVYEAGRHGSR